MISRIYQHVRTESFMVNVLYALLILTFIGRIVSYEDVSLRGIYGVNIMVFLGFIILIKVERVLKILRSIQTEAEHEIEVEQSGVGS